MDNRYYINETPSTNALMWEMVRDKNIEDGFVIRTDFQTSGKGQFGNSWESKAGENLLFSLVLFPKNILAENQFLISQFVSLAIKQTLDEYIDDVTIKWPNDIYWKDKKMAGILIENSLQGKSIRASVIGIGLNVNQKEFKSNAPNPVSLFNISGKEFDVVELLDSICSNIEKMYKNLIRQDIRDEYFESLYRNTGFHTFRINENIFIAKIVAVRNDGRLELEKENGETQGFYFKEVAFVI